MVRNVPSLRTRSSGNNCTGDQDRGRYYRVIGRTDEPGGLKGTDAMGLTLKQL